MFHIRFLIVTVFMCLVCATGNDAKRMTLEEDRTVLIDYVKYQERTKNHRMHRQYIPSIRTIYPFSASAAQAQDKGRDHKKNDCDNKECEKKVCDDPQNEVYQECGSKCVLGCRYATTSSGVTISKHDCEKNDCVEGCFCKTGLVRHQTKCIPASECPVRKCNHRYEVYMCGPAAPITCDNALRGVQISELTRHVECIWGCYCAQGYLRNNYNGKTILMKITISCIIGYQGSWQNPFPSGGVPVFGYPGFSGSLNHYHHFNESSVGLVPGNATDGCIGKYPCNAGLPVTQISLENGTTVTIPVIPGTQIDVATGTLNPSEEEIGNSEEEEDEEGVESVDGEPDEVDSNEKLAEQGSSNNNKPEMPSPRPPNNGNPNNGFPNPYTNPYLQFPYNGYPNIPPFNPYFGPPQFVPPIYYNNYPAFKKPQRASATTKAPVQTPKEENEQTSSDETLEEESEESENTENKDQSSMPDASIGIQTVLPMKNQVNSQQPSNYPSQYLNYFNSFNPNQYYQNNPNGFKSPNKPGYQQLVASNPQFNQFNPYNFQQNPYGNAQFNGFPNQGMNKKQNIKNRPYGSMNQPIPIDGYKYSNNKKFSTNAYKGIANPVVPPQNNEDSNNSDEDVEESEAYDDDDK